MVTCAFEIGDSKHHGREESERHTNNWRKTNLKELILGITGLNSGSVYRNI